MRSKLGLARSIALGGTVSAAILLMVACATRRDSFQTSTRLHTALSSVANVSAQSTVGRAGSRPSTDVAANPPSTRASFRLSRTFARSFHKAVMDDIFRHRAEFTQGITPENRHAHICQVLATVVDKHSVVLEGPEFTASDRHLAVMRSVANLGCGTVSGLSAFVVPPAPLGTHVMAGRFDVTGDFANAINDVGSAVDNASSTDDVPAAVAAVESNYSSLSDDDFAVLDATVGTAESSSGTWGSTTPEEACGGPECEYRATLVFGSRRNPWAILALVGVATDVWSDVAAELGAYVGGIHSASTIVSLGLIAGVSGSGIYALSLIRAE